MSSKTFTGITPDVWACIKAASIKEHSTVYDPPAAEEGTATTDTAVGKVVLQFVFDEDESTLVYTIQSKPFLVPESSLWSGVESSVEACGGVLAPS